MKKHMIHNISFYIHKKITVKYVFGTLNFKLKLKLVPFQKFCPI